MEADVYYLWSVVLNIAVVALMAYDSISRG